MRKKQTELPRVQRLFLLIRAWRVRTPCQACLEPLCMLSMITSQQLHTTSQLSSASVLHKWMKAIDISTYSADARS
jgi:hypothetical protein